MRVVLAGGGSVLTGKIGDMLTARNIQFSRNVSPADQNSNLSTMFPEHEPGLLLVSYNDLGEGQGTALDVVNQLNLSSSARSLPVNVVIDTAGNRDHNLAVLMAMSAVPGKFRIVGTCDGNDSENIDFMSSAWVVTD